MIRKSVKRFSEKIMLKRLTASATGLSLLPGFSIVGATGVNFGRRGTATACACCRCSRGRADAGLRQHQFDALGRLAVAGNVGRDRAYLFVAREHQEGRRAAIRLHARKVESG